MSKLESMNNSQVLQLFDESLQNEIKKEVSKRDNLVDWLCKTAEYDLLDIPNSSLKYGLLIRSFLWDESDKGAEWWRPLANDYMYDFTGEPQIERSEDKTVLQIINEIPEPYLSEAMEELKKRTDVNEAEMQEFFCTSFKSFVSSSFDTILMHASNVPDRVIILGCLFKFSDSEKGRDYWNGVVEKLK